MTNHFFISYRGNKRNEYKELKEFINFDNIKNIYESFCGSSAISFNIWKDAKDKFNYYLNDNDENLIYLYNYFKNNNIDDIYLKLNEIKETIKNKKDYDELRNKINFNKVSFKINEETVIYYLFFNKCYSIRAGLYPQKISTSPIKYNKELLLFVEFIKSPNVFITCDNWIKDFKDDKENLYIYDPPYILSDNNFYNNLDKSNNVYEYFYNNNIRNFKCKIIFILENNWVINLLFKDFIKHNYDKKYEVSKIKTSHNIICNY